MSRRDCEAGGKDRCPLHFGRQCSDNVDAGFRQQFADLLETDFRLPSRDDGRHALAFDPTALWQHFIRDAEPLKEFSREVCSADACRIRDRLRRQQGLPQGVERMDIGLRCSAPDSHADLRPRQRNACSGNGAPAGDQLFEGRIGDDNDVHGFAGGQSRFDRRGAGSH